MKAEIDAQKSQMDMAKTQAGVEAEMAKINAKAQADAMKTELDIERMIADAQLRDEGPPN